MNKNTAIDGQHWCASEFSSIDFRDKRLDQRFKKTVEQLSDQPMAPINKACESWGDTKGAYRLFANEKVSAAEILFSHQERTVKRISGRPLVLALQDSTFFDFTAHPSTEGIGHIGTVHGSHRQGLIMHSSLIVTPKGIPLGLLHEKIWAREKEPTKNKETHYKHLPIEEKETYKWIRAMKETKSLVPLETTVVTIGDREADLYEFMVAAKQLQAPFLIRAFFNRGVENEAQLLWDHMKEQPIRGFKKLKVPAKRKTERRTAKLSIRFKRVTLTEPKNRSTKLEKLPNIDVYAIVLTEQNPRSEKDKIEWLLLTSIAVNNVKDALRSIDWYSLRWGIEVFHKVMKSGCRVENCRLATADRLIKFLTVLSIVAWRLYWLTLVNRQDPHSPCSTVLGEHEWQSLYCKIHKTTETPKQTPTVYQTVRWVARLGGFLARKGDGEPGITTIWRGWQRLTDISEVWLLLRSEKTCG